MCECFGGGRAGARVLAQSVQSIVLFVECGVNAHERLRQIGQVLVLVVEIKRLLQKGHSVRLHEHQVAGLPHFTITSLSQLPILTT